MNQLDLLNLARACASNITSDLAQVITINFAMAIAIYYFLNQARFGLKLFAYFVYLLGMLMYIGQMVEESTVKQAAVGTLKALPPASLTGPVAVYIALSDTWLGRATTVFTNVALWMLVAGVFYLLFIWKKESHIRGFDSARD